MDLFSVFIFSVGFFLVATFLKSYVCFILASGGFIPKDKPYGLEAFILSFLGVLGVVIFCAALRMNNYASADFTDAIIDFTMQIALPCMAFIAAVAVILNKLGGSEEE